MAQKPRRPEPRNTQGESLSPEEAEALGSPAALMEPDIREPDPAQFGFEGGDLNC